jgi:hypothetical protein
MCDKHCVDTPMWPYIHLYQHHGWCGFYCVFCGCYWIEEILKYWTDAGVKLALSNICCHRIQYVVEYDMYGTPKSVYMEILTIVLLHQ